jgi:hypothetical protein
VKSKEDYSIILLKQENGELKEKEFGIPVMVY